MDSEIQNAYQALYKALYNETPPKYYTCFTIGRASFAIQSKHSHKNKMCQLSKKHHHLK